MDNKIFIGIAISIITALMIYPYVKLMDHGDRIISLEKDKYYLEESFKNKVIEIERRLNDVE